ncbi:MAG: hypothetical protein RIB03_07455 [Henriciella sp.]|uniref:hypothetical protein n=1 Tax=Henriciella sp. TaxID=1968823 RepID=UPI002606910E|nr:hypothetical protein [Henriciella sp.]
MNRTTLIRLAGLAAFALIILALAMLPGWRHPLGDKTEHIMAFAAMTILCLRSRTFLARMEFLLPIMVSGAIAIEVLQQVFSASRTASMSDVSASLIGIIAGIVVSQMKGRSFAVALIGLCGFALAMNWAINTGRYELIGMFHHA